MNIYSYLFKEKQAIKEELEKINKKSWESTVSQSKVVNTPKLKTIVNSYMKVNNIVFLVVEKNTLTPLGIFDSFEEAKNSGEKTTHNNCMIIPFTLNDSCKYLYKPSFESK
jgi:hypothetical protein